MVRSIGRSTASATPNALRFYGVMDAEDLDRGDMTVQGVSLVTFRDLSAVVAPAPYARTKQGDDELADYVRVIDAMYKLGPIIPAPPGTIFRDAGVLSHWMEIHYAKLHEALGVIERRESPTPPYDFVRMDLSA
ncbi:MAG: GvpL/GvpF family gas vesicle protein [Gemmatimonadaceae bacterium]